MIYMLKYPCGLICIAKTLGAQKQRNTVHNKGAISIEHSDFQTAQHSKAFCTFTTHIEFTGFNNFSSII